MFAWTCLFILLRDAVAFVSFVVFVSATAHYGAYSALFEIFETRNRWWRWKLLTAHIQLNAAIEDRIIKHQLYRYFLFVCEKLTLIVDERKSWKIATILCWWIWNWSTDPIGKKSVIKYIKRTCFASFISLSCFGRLFTIYGILCGVYNKVISIKTKFMLILCVIKH